LETADLQTATDLLGRPYSIRGRVIKGDKIGRLIGFPTANIEIDSMHKLVPADGIYAVTVQHEQAVYKGMLYIGYRPTIDGVKKSIEVNIFDFEKNIYGESLDVNFQQVIRGDAKFNDLEELKNQLVKDKQAALRILNQ
jgi:riboflavin kinase/FMN adenylyltransferase